MKRIRPIVNPDLRRALEAFKDRPGGDGRYVAAYWEPNGDELCLDNGRRLECGLSDNWAWLRFLRDPANRYELEKVQLGNSEHTANDWVVFDLKTNVVFVADAGGAKAFVRRPLRYAPGTAI
ncbi:MAG: hypothetical protein HYT87_13025 [Nitrospirae bacterium]|nr:hypothetical protein [Nitrospirota bacterium]